MDKDTGSGESIAEKMSRLLRNVFGRKIKNYKID